MLLPKQEIDEFPYLVVIFFLKRKGENFQYKVTDVTESFVIV